MPPYWSLGFHQCRYGYESLQDFIDVVNGYNASKVRYPAWEVPWGLRVYCHLHYL